MQYIEPRLSGLNGTRNNPESDKSGSSGKVLPFRTKLALFTQINFVMHTSTNVHFTGTVKGRTRHREQCVMTDELQRMVRGAGAGEIGEAKAGGLLIAALPL